MAFSFGAPAPSSGSPSKRPAAPAPAVSFGAASAPAASKAPAFSFGGGTPAPAASAAPAFSFGGSSNSSALAPSTTTAKAPAFSFGGSTAPVPSTAPAPAVSLTGGTPAPAASAKTTGTFSTANAVVVPTSQTTLHAPDFDATFENLELWNKVRKLCVETSLQHEMGERGTMSLAGQDLVHFVSTRATSLLKPRVVEWTPPNAALRQQLAQKPLIGWERSSPRTTMNTTTLTAKTMEEIGRLSTDLRIPEAQAITLYAQVSRDYDILHGLLTSNTVEGGGTDFVDQALPEAKYDEVTKLTRDFYFYERHLKLETILYLVEQRMQNNPDIILATDSLLKEGQLVSTLTSIVREYTERIEQLKEEIRTNPGHTNAPQTALMTVGGAPQQQIQQQATSQFAKVHLLFCTLERQTAAEILFFIAYHTQLEVPEVTGLIDLIRDLSAKTPKMCPFKDVPSPYETSDGIHQPYPPYAVGAPWPPTRGYPSHNSWDRKTKNPLDWQNELVQKTCESGQPKLLQCYSLLLVTAMAAMDTRQELYDRDHHAPNDFGRGNQFLHPAHPSLENIKELHERLKPDAYKQWARPDVWGLLACSYALLLRLTPSAIMSPTKGGLNSRFSKEVREAARYCMEEPAGLMSFTFCRLTLVPALEKIQSASLRSMCNISEFGLSVLSEMYSVYLNVLSEGAGNLPISRKRWLDREEEDLKLQREQYETQLKFEFFMGNNSQDGSATSKHKKVPASVDLMERHECLDDLIALATTLCALGPNYSRIFWAKDKDTNVLVPSRTLQECLVKASQDDSLLPCVYSWMAALSNDKESAASIHMLMSGQNNSEGIAPGVTSWYSVVHSLRFYVQHLSNNSSDNNLMKPSTPPATNSTRTNTSYYYNLDGNIMPDPNDNRSRGGNRSSSSSSSSSQKAMKPKELSEASKLRVASYLALIMNVSLHSFDARYKILSINLPLVEGDLTAGGDESLVVLFKLAIAPLSPEMRGATLSTIASLLQSTDEIQDPKVKTFLEEQGNNAWEYLECCSLLPINLLDRYRVVVPPTGTESQEQAGLSFPPTSLTLSSAASETESSIPKHPIYGILYELDHVESKKGWYPSTEGLLCLLESLVSSVGCPSKLGEKLRVRTGCTPYIEYVIHFVLPKALGVNNHAVLPFRVAGDRSRLVSRALAVVEAVIVRYKPPTLVDSKNFKLEDPSPVSVLGIQAVVDQVQSLSDRLDPTERMKDFMSLTVPSTLSTLDQQQFGQNYSPSDINQSMVASASVTSVPVPKSPAFTILVELLSSSCGVLLQCLGAILTECGGPNGVLSVFRDQSERLDMTYALYNSTPPNMISAKEGLKEDGPTKPLQSLLKPFSPSFQNANIDDHYVDDGVMWRETSISSALHILCAAAIREDAFITHLMASNEQPLKMVPVLEFKELKPGSSNALAFDNLKAKDVQVSHLTELLFTIKNSSFLRSTIVEYIGYDTVAKPQKTEISAAALSIVYRMQQTMSPQTSLHSLVGDEASTRQFSRAIAGRLLISSKNMDYNRDSEVVTLILNWILTELRSGTVTNNGLAQVLLGLPSRTADGNWKPGCGHYSGAISDCFDSIMEILTFNDMSGGVCGVSSLSFEIFFRLQNLIKVRDPTSLKIAIYTAERLREVDFWRDNVLRLHIIDPEATGREQLIQNLHSMAWLLKGLSCELRLLVGFQEDSISQSEFGRYLEQHPVQCNDLLSSLYGSESGVMIKFLNRLPLVKLMMSPNLPHPPQEALRAAVRDLPGAADVVKGYQVLDSTKIFSLLKQSPQEDLAKTAHWIEEYNFIAARSCALSHVTNALSVLIDASLYSAELMSSGYTAILNSSNFSTSWLHSSGPRDLLVAFLLRLEDVANSNDHPGMDSFLIPVATRNWSNAILTLSEHITSSSYDATVKSNELLRIAALVARIIPASATGDDTAEEAAFRYERTASLGSALAQLLRSSVSVEPGFAAQYRDDFIGAAHGLSNCAGFKVDSHDNNSLGIVSVLARSCLASIVVSLSQTGDESRFETSSGSVCISRVFLEHTISLVADLDEDICVFLQAIALQPPGAKMLIDAGVDRALLSAGRKYVEQEQIVIQDLETSASGFTKTTIRTPGFLLGHLKLICVLLSASDLPEEIAVDFAEKCMDIVGMYQATIKRLCYEFPVQADFLRWFLKVLVSASSIAKPLKKKSYIKKLGSRTDGVLSRARFFDNGISMLLEQLSENPLPGEMLPTHLPTRLRKPSGSLPGSKIVSVEKNVSGTWWDVLEALLDARADINKTKTFFCAPVGAKDYFVPTPLEKWSEDTFEYSIIAADIMSLGLLLLKRTERMDLFKTSSLARGLCHCVFATKTVCERLEDVRLKATYHANSMDTDDCVENTELELEYLRALASSLAKCVEQLLMLCLQVSDSKENRDDVAIEQIALAIESSGIADVSLGVLTEERSSFIRMICNEIKKLCNVA